MRKITMSLILFLLLFLLSSFSLASVPTQINYQGFLKNSSGIPVTGTYQITFAIYDDIVTTTSFWSETQTVTIEAGLYSVQLGSSAAIDPTNFDGTTKYLGVTVAGDSEMIPRIPLITVPYAFRAVQADTAQLANTVPPSISINTTGSITAAAFSGDGSGLTNISGTAIGGNADTLDGLSSEDFVRLGTAAAQTTDQEFGLYVETTGTAGVSGVASATGALENYGGIFGASGDSGRAVYGYASATGAHTNYGGFFQADGDNGYGVKAFGGSSGYGVWGSAPTGPGETNYGGYFYSGANSGYGVYGEAAGASGHGVFGHSASNIGVQGSSESGTGVKGHGATAGVYGETSAATGIGIHGIATNISGLNYGIFGQSDSSSGRGVYGIAAFTSGINYGVYGESNGSIGRGVYGLAADDSGTNYGVYGETESSYGYAGYFEGGQGVKLEAPAGAIILEENSSTPSDPSQDNECKIYLKDDKLIIQFDDGGTVRYKYLDLTGTGEAWTHTTSAP